MTEAPASAPTLTEGTWTIDASHSNIEFVVRHLLSKIRGRFTAAVGTITVGADATSSAVVVDIPTASIDTNHAERDRHLRSAEFLDSERYPNLSYRSTAVTRPDAEGRFQVVGELTIRDVTREVRLDAEYLGWSDDPWGGRRAGFTARAEIDRDDFGVSWNQVLDSGGFLLGKTVLLDLAVEAVLEQPS